ncbi:uncharacterized protein LOC112270732 [Brachypodium distachyon]|uniref:uncharacterized protein LOC112270732 n=1 Tax=Brachypodium distachyon TaxID=15368 RepID=UPI000D0C9877|nr:uncharacterized protein LOC112270732 [Brachypodium distachyon]|eukprot:XP_024314565.1 uncharacterized protein LOC112270732 [Brachypodium distachyon]
MKTSISPDIIGAIPVKDTAKEQFKSSEKVYCRELLSKLLEKYVIEGNVRGHILRMVNATSKLKALQFVLNENILILLILESLPREFDQCKINYNSLKEKWTLVELTPRDVEEEERIMKQGKDQAFFVASSKRKHEGGHGNFRTQKKPFVQKDAQKVPKGKGHDAGTSAGVEKNACNFCKEIGHLRKDCPGFLKWMNKGGIKFDPHHKGKNKKH